MTILKKQYAIIRNFLAVIGMVAAYSSLSAGAEPLDNQKIAARVNGVPIYESELAPGAGNRIKQYRQLGSKATDGELRRRFQLKEIDSLIAQELLAQAGAILFKSQDIEDKLTTRLASSLSGTNEKPALTKEQQEAHANKLRKDIQRESYLESKGLLNPKIDEKTLRNFYDQNRRSFQEPKSVKAGHILIQLPKAPTADQTQEAQAKAMKILADLKEGKDFALLAIQSSDCNTKINGGDLGFIKQGFMPKEFDAVAFELKPGETSGIVKTRYGLHIIRVEESKPEIIREFNEVKEYIAGFLKNDFQQRKIDEQVQELKKTAKIEILL